MISRLTAIATTFAIGIALLATASLEVKADAHQATIAATAAPAKAVRVVQLERVVIVAQRLPADAR